MLTRAIVPAVATALALLLAIPAGAGTAGPGAPGIGDPYYPDAGNGGYDVAHYDLRLHYQPATDALRGTALITATATQGLTRFDLDFVLTATAVTVDGRPARFGTGGEQELVVTPARPLRKGERFTVAVSYTGVPSTVRRHGVTAWQRTPDGAVAADEPESAAWWFPSNDHPLDKAAYDVRVQVPAGDQALSNGLPAGERTAHGWTTYHWRERRPQATYLATLAVGHFDVTRSRTRTGIPVINAYSPALPPATAAHARAAVERTAEIVDFLSGWFGPYPFESAGGYVPDIDSQVAQETQTRPFYGSGYFADDANTGVVAHELTHQWYGDSVSLSRWAGIWLNEGFATYGSWLWWGHEHGATVQQIAQYTYDLHPAGDPFWSVEPGDPGPARLFDHAVDDRGALTLQVLRDTVGEHAFRTLLTTWAARHRYGNATVADFRRLAEQVSGKDLTSLFRTWLYTPGKPAALPAGS